MPCRSAMSGPERLCVPATSRHCRRRRRVSQHAFSPHDGEGAACSPNMYQSQLRTNNKLCRRPENHHLRGHAGIGMSASSSSSGETLFATSRRRHVKQPSLSTARRKSAAIVLLVNAIAQVKGVDVTTEYLKPAVSSKACMEVAGEISEKTSRGNDIACMQCDPANNVCPPGCQVLIDALYRDCDGVTTPDGLYYDPDWAIEGEWSDKIKAKIKIATERCGCDHSVRLAPLRGDKVFGTSLVAWLGVVAMTSLASWFGAVWLLLPPDDHR